MLLAAASAQASSGPVSYFQFERELCDGTGNCSHHEPNAVYDPTAVGVNADGIGDAAAGDVYVLEEGHGTMGTSSSRIQQFGSGHEFVRLWGVDVVKSGPGNADESQGVRVEASGGTFRLGFGADTTADIPVTATAAQVEAALNGLSSIGTGGASVSGGPGDAGGTTPYLVSFIGGALAGADQPLLKATNGSIPLSGGAASVSAYTTNHGGNGLEICRPLEGDECKEAASDSTRPFLRFASDVAVDQATGNVYVLASNQVEAYSAAGQLLRTWGNDVIASGPDDSVAPDEQQKITVKATGGSFTLGFTRSFGQTPPITVPIPYDADADVVEAALNALSTVGGDYGSVSVTGGPGDAGGSNPYTVTFHGSLGGDDHRPMSATATSLQGPEKAVTTTTDVEGGGSEVCDPSNACKGGSTSGPPGTHSFEGPSGIAVAPVGAPNEGNVLLSDIETDRVLEFTPGGAFVRAFGWDVNATEPTTDFEVCTAASGDACKAGTQGTGIGQLDGPLAVAVDSTGAIYVAEIGSLFLPGPANQRVQKFTPAGGLDLTPLAFGTNEVQALTVNAGAGQFRLSLGAEVDGAQGTGELSKSSSIITNVKVTKGPFSVGQPITTNGGHFERDTFITAVSANTITLNKPPIAADSSAGLLSYLPYRTSNLPYNATAVAVEAALNALPSISAEGGSVSVADSGGSFPYLIEFDGGPLARVDAPHIVASSGDTPLSGGSGPGANTASVLTATPGGPAGASFEEWPFVAPFQITPFDLAVDPEDHVLVARNYPTTFTTCANGLPSPDETRVQELDPSGTVIETSDPCTGIPVYQQQSRLPSLTANATTGRPYLIDPVRFRSEGGDRLYVFGPPGPSPSVALEPILSITPTAGTIAGTIDPNGPGTEYPDVTGTPSSYRTTYRVEYKKASEAEWTKYTPDTPIGSGFDPVAFSVGVAGLAPKTPYELKVVTVKPFTATVEAIETFTTAPAPPEIESLFSSNVTASSADLHATINPQGTETTYHFEYGTTTAYGQSTPETNIGESLEGEEVTDHVEGLEDTVYHFRVVATNALGTVTSEDQTFTFHPPVCPNQTVRQQTGAAYLPDCRAYELVSPEDAGGTTLFTGGPQSPYASNPPRLAFVGQLAAIPGSGRNPINTVGDLYLATRGASRWTTRYIGPSAEEAACVGGRPIVNGTGPPTTIQNDVMADPGLDRILNWNLGNPLECAFGYFGGLRFYDYNTAARGSNAPYVWDANGDFLDRWPTSAADVPGAKENFDCPQDPKLHPYPPGVVGNIPVPYFCTTYVDASKDLSHFVFSTQSGLFGQGGLSQAPGSAYDNDTDDNTLNLVSELQNGEPIGQEPGAKAGSEELIQFPSVSEDGSHILMGTATKSACKQIDYPYPNATEGNDKNPTCPIITQPTHLYMRVDDAVTYDVSVGKAVKYIDSTADGTKVYFTSAEQLTSDDEDESVDLFMWSENGGAPQVVRISAGEPSPTGNSDNCVSTWTSDCDIATYDDTEISTMEGNRGGLGSWNSTSPNPGYTDNAIAAESGDIYFYSPEQLVEGKGVPGKENLYVYREGSVRHVAALEDDPYCIDRVVRNLSTTKCSDGAVGRLQVTPNGRFAAFITTSKVTPYDNEGFAQMYRYDAQAEELQCVSCVPDGSPPSGDVLGSQGGRFITDDGRVFFNTPEALDPRDTNAGLDSFDQVRGFDVYEFVEGRPQLITSGTGTEGGLGGLAGESVSGLYGVSADGVDVYFGTSETLVGQDRNGTQLKFYDARTNGGFSFVPPPLPCAAADECRGPVLGAPAPIANGTGVALGASGNARQGEKRKAKKRKAKKQAQAQRQKQKRQKRNRAAQRQKGGQR